MMVMKSTFKPNYKRIPETIMSFNFGIGVMMNNFIFHATDKAMGQMIQNGIPQYFVKYLDEVDFHPMPADEKEPKVFGLDDLAFGFNVFLVYCGISFLTFVAELLYFYATMLIGLVMFLRSLTNRILIPSLMVKALKYESSSKIIRRYQPEKKYLPNPYIVVKYYILENTRKHIYKKHDR